LLLMNSLNHL